MILEVIFCASILAARPGCEIERTRLHDANPFVCAIKAQEVVAERGAMHEGARVARYGCRRDRNREAEAKP